MNYHGSCNTYEIKKVIYADDIIIFTNKMEDLINGLENLNKNIKSFGMQISFKKTEIMEINQPENNFKPGKYIKIDDNKVKIVNKCTHLGRIICNGMNNQERHIDNIRNRIKTARGCFKCHLYTLWKNDFVNLEIKMKMFDSLIISVLFYRKQFR